MSFHFIYIQTPFFPIFVSRHINATYDEKGNTREMESVKKNHMKMKWLKSSIKERVTK